MAWTCDVYERGEDTYEKAIHKNAGKMTKKKIQNQMDIPNKGYRNERGKLERNTRKQEVGEQKWLEISL